ncbi:hypothetical protein BCY86_03025 [Pajaroellobacter abortibovis]|uniref:Uncharacterized protein n=1 Tax=Pajaroellobacter abortibovis TaxID=1882918 RepID=A0A1L6MW70_9BACT|nr:hypothetical protein BCY86_03025 [Pajaroellobacter abortibovis]
MVGSISHKYTNPLGRFEETKGEGGERGIGQLLDEKCSPCVRITGKNKWIVLYFVNRTYFEKIGLMYMFPPSKIDNKKKRMISF